MTDQLTSSVDAGFPVDDQAWDRRRVADAPRSIAARPGLSPPAGAHGHRSLSLSRAQRLVRGGDVGRRGARRGALAPLLRARPRAVPRRRRRSPPPRCLLCAPRRPPRRRRQGRGRVRALPVPRLGLRGLDRALHGDPVRQERTDPPQGAGPELPDDRARRGHLGVASPPRRRSLLRAAGRARDRRRRGGLLRSCASSGSRRRARRWRRTTTTSLTSCTCTGPIPSPRVKRSSKAPTSPSSSPASSARRSASGWAS